MKKIILASTGILLSVSSFAQAGSTNNMMNHDKMNNNSWSMNWGMGYGFWILAIIFIVAIGIFLMNRRRKN